MKTTRISKMAAAAVATGGIAASMLAATTVAAQAADVAVDVNHVYNCNVVAGGIIPLGKHDIGVNTQVMLPTNVEPGETIATRQAQITLSLPETLRDTTYNTVGGRSAEGSSTDTKIELVLPGKDPAQVPLLNLASVAPVPLPTNEEAAGGAKWSVPAVGTVPAVDVPADVSGTAVINMPQSFNISATIYKADNSTLPATMACTFKSGDNGRQLATVKVGNAPTANDVTGSTAYGTAVNVALSASDEQTPAEELVYAIGEQPANGTAVLGEGANVTYTPNENFAGTDTFTYTVTDGDNETATATATVSVAKAASATKATAPKTAKAGKALKVKVVVTSEAAASGKVSIKVGKKTVGSAKVKAGKATVTISKKATKKLKGKQTLKVSYAGSDVVDASKTSVKVKFKK